MTTDTSTPESSPSAGVRPVALVTGGGSGIGAAACRALDKRGYSVAVADLDGLSASGLAEQLGDAAGFEVDVADSGAVDELVSAVVERFGRLDVAVTAAGVDDPDAKALIGRQNAAGEPIDATISFSDAAWRRMLGINLDGTFYTVRAALRVMTEQLSGSIVTVASSAAYDAPAGYCHYSAAKAGVVALTQSVGKEAVAHGIRVNGVAPGPTRTPMTARTPAQNFLPTAGHLVRPPASAEEIAEIICFLAGDGAANLAGETILANGGRFTAY
jgi:NAD(P)-dependent dehydrogenase (short-subunit alcohol dehydrogenase family)